MMNGVLQRKFSTTAKSFATKDVVIVSSARTPMGGFKG